MNRRNSQSLPPNLPYHSKPLFGLKDFFDRFWRSKWRAFLRSTRWFICQIMIYHDILTNYLVNLTNYLVNHIIICPFYHDILSNIINDCDWKTIAHYWAACPSRRRWRMTRTRQGCFFFFGRWVPSHLDFWEKYESLDWFCWEILQGTSIFHGKNPWVSG